MAVPNQSTRVRRKINLRLIKVSREAGPSPIFNKPEVPRRLQPCRPLQGTVSLRKAAGK